MRPGAGDPESFYRYVPEIRDHVVGSGRPKTIGFKFSKPDFGSVVSQDVLLAGGVIRLGRRLWRSRDVEVLELPEPLWSKYWPAAASLAVLCKLKRALQRQRIQIVTYAIENAEPDSRLSVPLLDKHQVLQRLWLKLIRTAWGASVGVVDTIVFGTEDSQRVYQKGFAAIRTGHVRSALVLASLATCGPCGLVEWDSRPATVAFVGEVSARKGVDTLLAAWPEVEQACPDYRLLIVGDGPLRARAEELAQDHRVQLLGWLEGACLHDVYAGARVVVLPSRSVVRWREQIGLPALEGEAHGCRVVISTDSGIATELTERSGAIAVPSSDPPRLAQAIVCAIRLGAPPRQIRQGTRADIEAVFEGTGP